MTNNLRIWSAVEKTNPAHTKKVNQRGGFTAISAAFQIKAATEQFGPIGIGWGYIAHMPIITDGIVIVPVTLWHGARENAFGPMMGAADMFDSRGKVDSDAPKKATTDALTKLLSQLGFNADVFLGKFDDNKYVEQMKAEFAAKDEPKDDKSKPDPDALISDKTLTYLQDLIAANCADVAEVCREYKVMSLKALRFGQVSAVAEWIKQKRAA